MEDIQNPCYCKAEIMINREDKNQTTQSHFSGRKHVDTLSLLGGLGAWCDPHAANMPSILNWMEPKDGHIQCVLFHINCELGRQMPSWLSWLITFFTCAAFKNWCNRCSSGRYLQHPEGSRRWRENWEKKTGSRPGRSTDYIFIWWLSLDGGFMLGDGYPLVN